MIGKVFALRTGSPILEGLFIWQPEKKPVSLKLEEFEWEIRCCVLHRS